MLQTAPPCHKALANSYTLRLFILSLLFGLLIACFYAVPNVIQSDSASSPLPTQTGIQHISGPILIIPYTEHVTSIETVTSDNQESRVLSKDIFTDYTTLLLPNVLDIKAKLKTQNTTKNPHKAQTYIATIQLEGRFDYGFILEAEEGKRTLHWDKAWIAVGISEPQGILDNGGLHWGDDLFMLQPSTRLAGVLNTGFHVPLPIPQDEEEASLQDFELSLTLQGHQGFYVSPLGEVTAISMSSDWETPEFSSNFPPQQQEISRLGFKADWEIPNLVRNYPQFWQLKDSESFDLNSAQIGVTLKQVDPTAQSIQQLKHYSMLLLAAVFLSYFALELFRQRQLHLLQYLVVGTLVLMVPLLIHALNQYLAWPQSYIIVAAGVCLLIWLYSWRILRHAGQALFILLVVGGLYALGFWLLDHPDLNWPLGLALSCALLLLLLLATTQLSYTAIEER